ncbi:MAG TPA: YciI family protein [Myxococcota bacterium]|nr:YciI family protein [Myxococcota bacterium]
MRIMMLLKASKASEAGVMPSTELLAEMGKYNEELIRAGVLIDGAGLQASAKGARVRFSGKKRIVIDGPFTETKELVAGFWIWQVKSIDDAVEWLKRAPFGGGEEVEIRPIFEEADFMEQLG